MKTEERIRARELRSSGRSVREIAELLQLPRSSISLWVRDVRLSPAQRRALDERAERGRAIACKRKADAACEIRREYQHRGRLLVRENGASYAAGCMLFWAEGDKCRNAVRISNSDPEVLVVFAAFLRDHFRVSPERMTIACNLFADHLDRQREIEGYWLARLGLAPSSLRKSMVNIYSKHSKKTRKNRLPYGTCKLVVHSTQIVQTIYGSIQEYGGFDRPEWLD